MGIYNTFGYSDGTLYGSSSKIEYNVSPFDCVSIDYVKDGGDIIRPSIVLNWTNPAGAILGFRIVRNQDGFSETEEDGHIIFEVFNGLPTIQSLTDKDFVIPLIPGLYAYYTIWLLRPDQTWFPAGTTFCLVPKEHSINTPDGSILISAQDKFVGLLPRAYTTLQQSYVDEIDPSSDIYSFLGGFSFTLDELLTYIDTVTPDISGKATNPNFVGVQANQLGLPAEPTLGIRTQKRLIRQAVNVYKTRGTLIGLQTFIESLTSFAPVITLSPNVMIDAQNSSFYKTVGNWKADSNCAITSVIDNTPYQLENFSVDRAYSGKVVTDDVDAVVSNGISNPKLEGTPVKPGVSYDLSWYQTSPTDTGNITPVITWFGYAGNVLGAEVTGAPSAVSNVWERQTLTATSPGLSVNVTAVSVASEVATVVVDAGHPFSIGDTAIFYDLGYPFNGAQIITATTSTSVSFAVAGDDVALKDAAGVAHEPYAVFAGIQFTFDSVGTFYLDMVQLADNTDVRSADFYEARALELYLTPSKTNYIEDPSFSDTSESDPSLWATTGATSVASVGPTTVPGIFDSSEMYEITTADSSALEVSAYTTSVPANAYYTFSLYAQTDADVENLSLSITAIDSTDTVIVGTNGLDVTNATAMEVTTAWTRFSVTLYVPNTSTSVHFKVSVSGTTGDNVLRLDAAQLERGYAATDYFDGSYSSRGAFWLGEVNNSVSVLYRNKSNKIGRLVADLPNNLPMNTPWVITTGSPTVKVLETSGFSS